MYRALLCVTACALLPASVVAQAAQQPAPPAAPALADAPPTPPTPAQYAYVALTTSMGRVVLALDKTHAPKTTANFLKYVDTRRMDGALFYRAMHFKSAPDDGLLQGGIRDASKLLAPVAHEPTSITGLHNKAGTISMARFAPGTATSDFIILLSDMPSLDAKPGNDGTDPGAGFAAFGHVVSGMDVVRAIWNTPRSPTKGQGVMKGQMLEHDVKILSARRIPEPSAAAGAVH